MDVLAYCDVKITIFLHFIAWTVAAPPTLPEAPDGKNATGGTLTDASCLHNSNLFI